MPPSTVRRVRGEAAPDLPKGAAARAAAEPTDLLHRKSLGDQLYGILEERIVTAALPPASRLSEEAIAEEFAISRSPVREVLAKLERIGFAERSGVRDRRVAVPTAKFVADTYETWIVLEVGRTYLSCQAATPDDHEAIRAHLAAMAKAWRQPDRQHYMTLSDAYPDLLHGRCDNHQLLRVLGDFEKYRRWLTALYLRDVPPSPTSLAEHKAIGEHYIARDLVGLSDSIRVHIQQQRDCVLEQLGQGE
jgi:DNA-binding GntR family transcriptional regulator